MQNLLWALVLLVNVVTLIVFGYDKIRSKRQNARRVPERTLLGLMFFGGLLGGWAGMKLFRHKTVKRSFRIQAMLVTVFSPAWLLVWWWYTTLGGESA